MLASNHALHSRKARIGTDDGLADTNARRARPGGIVRRQRVAVQTILQHERDEITTGGRGAVRDEYSSDDADVNDADGGGAGDEEEEDAEESVWTGPARLPALPTASGRLHAVEPDWVVNDARAKVSLERCNRWAHAFRTAHGRLPSAEEKASSRTFCDHERKYREAIGKLSELNRTAAAEEEEAERQQLLLLQQQKQQQEKEEREANDVGAKGSLSVFGVLRAARALERAAVQTSGGDNADGAFRKPIRSNAISSSRSGSNDGDDAAADGGMSQLHGDATYLLLQEACARCLLFASSGRGRHSGRHQLIDGCIAEMIELPVAAGATVIHEGAAGDHFYVVASGTYEAFISSVANGAETVKTYRAGDTFGELALMYNTPRAATIRCKHAGVIYSLDRMTFRDVLMRLGRAHNARTLAHLRSVPMFGALSAAQLTRLAAVCEDVSFDARTTVVRQGEVVEHLYVVTGGVAFAKRWGFVERYEMLPRTSFGESAFAREGPPESRMRKADVVAEPGCQMMRLSVADFVEVVGRSVDDVARRNANVKLLEGVKVGGRAIGSLMTRADLEKIANAMEQLVFVCNEEVTRESDEQNDALHIIQSGEALLSSPKTGRVEMIKDGAVFGVASWLHGASQPHTVTVASRELTCLALSRATFTRLLGPPQELLLTAKRLATSEKLLPAKPIMSAFSLHQIIGRGANGHVTLAQKRGTKACYALKCMHKGRLAKFKQVDRALAEREALHRCSHPFIVALASTLQDVETVYLLLEYVPGGQLHSMLRESHHLTERAAAFYAACVTSAIEHIHDRSILHRDLKVESPRTAATSITGDGCGGSPPLRAPVSPLTLPCSPPPSPAPRLLTSPSPAPRLLPSPPPPSLPIPRLLSSPKTCSSTAKATSSWSTSDSQKSVVQHLSIHHASSLASRLSCPFPASPNPTGDRGEDVHAVRHSRVSRS